MIPIPRVLEAVYGRPWAILPAKLNEICAVVEEHRAGVRLTAGDVQERIGPQQRPEPKVEGSIAVIPLYGVMAQRMNALTAISGGTSTELFGKALREYVEDPEIASILIDVDSPGGSVFGVGELASDIRALRGRKPIYAIANSLAASAAYYVASQADQLFITPSGLVGSIGVLMAHTDMSKAEEMGGYKTTLVSAGKYKTENSPYGPLTEEGRAEMQSKVDKYYAQFVAAVAAGRRTTPRDVRDNYGGGRVLTAEDAVAAGMADRVATRDQVISILRGKPASRSVRAMDRPAEIAAEVAAKPTSDAKRSDHKQWLAEMKARTARAQAREADRNGQPERAVRQA